MRTRAAVLWARPMTPEGLVIRRSAHGPLETVERLATRVTDAGMQVFARIDHAAGARSAGMTLRPTIVLIFGAPRAGTPLMQAAPTIAIDLPLRALVWEDDALETWVGYDDPHWLAQRHRVGSDLEPVLARIAQTLRAVTDAAASADERGST